MSNSSHLIAPDCSADAIGARWGAVLAEAYGPGAAKRIAHAFGVDVRTAHKWLDGQPPSARHLARAGVLHGAGFVAAVVAPASDLAELGRARAEIARLRDAAAAVQRMAEDLLARDAEPDGAA